MSLTCTVTLTCDSCGATLTAVTEPHRSPVRVEAVEHKAAMAGWIRPGGEHRCPKCHPFQLGIARRYNGMIKLTEHDIQKGNAP